MIAEQSKIEITKVAQSRLPEVDFENLKFGREFSDHMFIMEYSDGKWGTPRIEPFGKLELHPAISALHYGQSIFEGMKAYKNGNNDVLLFRPTENAERLNRSATRMCMPEVPEELFMTGLRELINLDREWVPSNEGSSLYIRPFMFATDEYIGIKPSDTYLFIIFTCPVGSYYSEPLRVKIEEYYTRAAEGGVGQAKAAGNYAASLFPAKQAQAEGYHQLIWTDGKEHKYIEESGTMNVIFRIGDKLITPPTTTGTILPGITRKSVLTIARDWGMDVEERSVEVAEIIGAAKNGELLEAFGAGTAATIAQIKTINYKGEDYELPAIESREFSNKVFDYLNKLKHGEIEDKFDWVVRV